MFAVRCFRFASFALLFSLINSEGLGRGLGDDINWKTLEDGLLEAAKKKKPLLLIVHKSWCGACKAFKPKFAESQQILEMSKHFVMVNVLDNEEPNDSKYKPDGGYIPRVLFLDPEGNVQTEIFNKNGNKNYKYFYSDAESVLESMKYALEALTEDGKKEL